MKALGLVLGVLAMGVIAGATTPRRLVLTPTRGDTVTIGDTTSFRAVAYDTRGRVVPRAAIVWTVSDTAASRLVPLAHTALVLGRDEATVTLTATWRDVSASRTLVVACARRGLAHELSVDSAGVTHLFGLGWVTDRYVATAGLADTLVLAPGAAGLVLRFCLPAQSPVAYHFPTGVVWDGAHGPPGVTLTAPRPRARTS